MDQTFHEEVINYSRSRSHMLNMSHFKDDSGPNGSRLLFTFVESFLYKKLFGSLIFLSPLFSAWAYSAWVRFYALFLEERLECFRVLKYDVEVDPPVSVWLHLFCYELSEFSFTLEITRTCYKYREPKIWTLLICSSNFLLCKNFFSVFLTVR